MQTTKKQPVNLADSPQSRLCEGVETDTLSFIFPVQFYLRGEFYSFICSNLGDLWNDWDAFISLKTVHS